MHSLTQIIYKLYLKNNFAYKGREVSFYYSCWAKNRLEMRKLGNSYRKAIHNNRKT